MDATRFAILGLGLGLGLALGGCADMMGRDEPMVEPAAGPAATTGMERERGDTGLTESEAGDMMDSDDDEGAGDVGGGGPGVGTQ